MEVIWGVVVGLLLAFASLSWGCLAGRLLPEGAELDMDDPETSVVSVEVPEDTTESAAAAPAADADAAAAAPAADADAK